MKDKYNFSRRHWGTIVMCFLLFFISNAVTSDSENVLLPLLSADNGWDYYGKVLTFASVAGCVSIAGNLILGKVCEKLGAKFLIISGLLATACFVFLYGRATSYPALVIGLIGTICFGQSISFLGGNAIIASWFPRKKGLAMGFVTVGPPAATVAMVSALTFLIGKTGVRGGIYTICGVLIVAAAACALFIHNTPEQVGCTPDNLSPEVIKEPDGESPVAEKEKAVLTTWEMVKKKELWLVTLIAGICSIAQTGLMAQWIVRYDGTTFENIAGLMMSICAVVGIFGSMIAGFLENKLGTKRAYVFLALWFAVGLLLNFSNVPALVYISIPMFGLIITLYQIFMPVFELGTFGRENFKQANAVIFPVSSICGQLAFVVISLCKTAFGEVRYTYIFFAALLVFSAFLALALRSDGEQTEEKKGRKDTVFE